MFVGLYISRQFVQLMGGDITVRSRVHSGSTFTITLTLPRASPQSSPSLSPTPSPPSPHPRAANSNNNNHTSASEKAQQRKEAYGSVSALVVDDNSINQLIAIKMLDQLGVIDVAKASDGDEALEMMKEKRYDLVFMDCKFQKE
jgi:hypothetical protein